MKAKNLIRDKDDIYKRLNVSETDSNWSNAQDDDS